ncbi:unannotated protein [freshwater metagenome]|uniref:Unannotated protein n=1 Tax=freshwater metagenome TaxID=449393 RepID=A0A6J6XVW6_9ZZZZ
MGIAACAAGEIEFFGEGRCLGVERLERGLRVQNLNGIDEPVVGKVAHRALFKVAAHRIERVRDIDQAALVSNKPRSLARLHTNWHSFVEEQPDDFARVGLEFFAHNDPAWQVGRDLKCTTYRVVVCNAQHVDTARDDCVKQLVGGGRGISAPHCVTVQIDAHPSVSQGFCEMWVPLDCCSRWGWHLCAAHRDVGDDQADASGHRGQPIDIATHFDNVVQHALQRGSNSELAHRRAQLAL